MECLPRHCIMENRELNHIGMQLVIGINLSGMSTWTLDYRKQGIHFVKVDTYHVNVMNFSRMCSKTSLRIKIHTE